MGNFDKKLERFWEVFIEHDGYVKVLTGLQNTVLIIAVLGLAIGILIGTIIAIIRVYPKYNRLPKILNGICVFYVGLFRGTPIVVQLLLAYYVILPLIGVESAGTACVRDRLRSEQRGICIGDHAKRDPVRRSRPDGSGAGPRPELPGNDAEGRRAASREEHPANPRQRVHRFDQGDFRGELRRRCGSLRGL